MAAKTLITIIITIILCLLTPTTTSSTPAADAPDIVETKDGYMIVYENGDTYFVDTLNSWTR